MLVRRTDVESLCFVIGHRVLFMRTGSMAGRHVATERFRRIASGTLD
jgi:hypothetical protein